MYAVGPAAVDAVAGLPKRRKIAGPTRYATALAVARRFFPEPRSVVLAYGGRHTDALLGASYAGRTGAPLLLMRRNRVPSIVGRYLREHHGDLHGSVLAGDDSGVSAEGFRQAFRLVDPR